MQKNTLPIECILHGSFLGNINLGEMVMKNLLVAMGSIAAVGTLIFSIYVWAWTEQPPPPPPPPLRAMLVSEDKNLNLASLQIRSQESGNWNQYPIAENGDTTLSPEYANKKTIVWIYQVDRKTLVCEAMIDLSGGKPFCVIKTPSYQSKTKS